MFLHSALLWGRKQPQGCSKLGISVENSPSLLYTLSHHSLHLKGDRVAFAFQSYFMFRIGHSLGLWTCVSLGAALEQDRMTPEEGVAAA